MFENPKATPPPLHLSVMLARVGIQRFFSYSMKVLEAESTPA